MRSGTEIRRILREGRRRRSASLDVFISPSSAGRPRAGVIVSRHGHTIVERNRLKRRLRELLRREWLAPAWAGRVEAPALDVLVLARPAAYGRTRADLRRELRSVLHARPGAGQGSRGGP